MFSLQQTKRRNEMMKEKSKCSISGNFKIPFSLCVCICVYVYRGLNTGGIQRSTSNVVFSDFPNHCLWQVHPWICGSSVCLGWLAEGFAFLYLLVMGLELCSHARPFTWEINSQVFMNAQTAPYQLKTLPVPCHFLNK